MIGVDTNILVRAYLEDDKQQAKEAQELLLKYTKDKILFISSYAILEFAWVLKVKRVSREEIGQKDVVLNAVEKYIAGKADFGDYMILAEGEKNKSYTIKTFDKQFQKEL